MKHIQIIGAGLMGSGIAEVCIKSGFSVTLIDSKEGQLLKAKERLSHKLSSEECANLHFLGHVEKKTTHLLIEAIIENRDLKEDFWRSIDSKMITMMASNTSSYSISELASYTTAPEKFIGIHFMNPVPKMPLVEVIRGEQTSDEIYNQAQDFVATLGKVSVSVQDSPGFIVNRILIPMINDAINLLDEGVASTEDIDTAMKLGANHPLGPLSLADLIGLDTCLAIMQDLYERLGSEKYKPASLLREHVQKGHLGRKSGKGFFTYN